MQTIRDRRNGFRRLDLKCSGSSAVTSPGDDFDFEAAIAQERRDARKASRLFFDACGSGDVGALYTAVDAINYTVDSWRHAMFLVGKLPAVNDDIRAAFLPIWIESKMLPRFVGSRTVLARALRLLLPCHGAVTGPMVLYRGAQARERKRRSYGFSWTRSPVLARDFGAPWQRLEDGGVVLQTIAPPESILLIRDDPEYYDESEVVVDPFKLGKVKVREWLPHIPAQA